MAVLTPQQQQEQMKRFFNPESDWAPSSSGQQQPSAPSDQPAPQPAAAAPSAASQPNMQPPAATPAVVTPPSTTTPAPQGNNQPDNSNYLFKPQGFDEWHTANGDVPLQSPAAAPHHGTLAKIMLTLGELIGSPLASKIQSRDRDLQLQNSQFEQNKPALQYEANQNAYKQSLTNQEQQARTRHENVESDIAGQNLPVQEQAEKEYNDLVGHWQNKDVPDFDTYANMRMQAMPNAIARRISPLLASIKQLPQTGKGYSLTMQDDVPKSVNVFGKEYDRNDPELMKLPTGAAATADYDRALQAHQTKRNEHLQDATFTANAAADRQGKSIGAAIQAAQTAESNKTLNTGRQEAVKHLNDMRSAQNQLNLVDQLASSKSPTDQTSLAFKALGLDLPEGVHRINETELNAIRSQGGLADKAYRALLNWKSGEQFAPDILQDIKGTASKIANSKIKNSNDNLEDVNRVYGYKVQGSDTRGRLDGQNPAQQQSSPQTHKFSLSAWQKANPQGDVKAAEAAARAQKYEVVP